MIAAHSARRNGPSRPHGSIEPTYSTSPTPSHASLLVIAHVSPLTLIIIPILHATNLGSAQASAAPTRPLGTNLPDVVWKAASRSSMHDPYSESLRPAANPAQGATSVAVKTNTSIAVRQHPSREQHSPSICPLIIQRSESNNEGSEHISIHLLHRAAKPLGRAVYSSCGCLGMTYRFQARVRVRKPRRDQNGRAPGAAVAVKDGWK